MKDQYKTKKELIAENDGLRQRIQELEQRLAGDLTSLDFSPICRSGPAMLRDGRPQHVALDAEQLLQILTDLVTSAWKSAESERPFAIRLATTTVPAAGIPPAHRFPIDWQPEVDSYFCLELVDNGCGIPEADLPELFNTFFSTKFTGRGLGLPMVLGLVQANSGVVTVESIPGHGSAVRVFLPVAVEGDADRSAETTFTTEDRPAGKILLVDDDGIIVDITSMMLVKLGFTVLSAGDGRRAVEIFRQRQDEICLVLSDVYMPGMNGWETLSALRRIDPDIAVILISGYGEEQIMEGDHPDLPQAFLEKPYSFEELKDALRRALRDTAKYASCRGLLDPSGT
jgi:CheY-like chemotaxis protein